MSKALLHLIFACLFAYQWIYPNHIAIYFSPLQTVSLPGAHNLQDTSDYHRRPSISDRSYFAIIEISTFECCHWKIEWKVLFFHSLSLTSRSWLLTYPNFWWVLSLITSLRLERSDEFIDNCPAWCIWTIHLEALWWSVKETYILSIVKKNTEYSCNCGRKSAQSTSLVCKDWAWPAQAKMCLLMTGEIFTSPLDQPSSLKYLDFWAIFHTTFWPLRKKTIETRNVSLRNAQNKKRAQPGAATSKHGFNRFPSRWVSDATKKILPRARGRWRKMKIKTSFAGQERERAGNLQESRTILEKVD